MEPLWSPVVATGGNQPQTYRARRRRKQAKSVATVCHQLPEKFHGKEGVDGSSPSEGFAKSLQAGGFFYRLQLHDPQHAMGMEPFMEPSPPHLQASAPTSLAASSTNTNTRPERRSIPKHPE